MYHSHIHAYTSCGPTTHTCIFKVSIIYVTASITVLPGSTVVISIRYTIRCYIAHDFNPGKCFDNYQLNRYFTTLYVD